MIAISFKTSLQNEGVLKAFVLNDKQKNLKAVHSIRIALIALIIDYDDKWF